MLQKFKTILLPINSTAEHSTSFWCIASASSCTEATNF